MTVNDVAQNEVVANLCLIWNQILIYKINEESELIINLLIIKMLGYLSHSKKKEKLSIKIEGFSILYKFKNK